jgi:hypothetical protein
MNTTTRWRENKLSELGELTPEEYLIRNVRIFSDYQMARSLSSAGFEVTTNAVRKKRRRLGIQKIAGLGDGDFGLRERVLESPFQRFDESITLEGNVAILGDVEFPFHNADFLNMVLGLCDKWDIRRVIFNGDLLHHATLTTFSPEFGVEANIDGLPDTAMEVLIEIRGELPRKHQSRLGEFLDRIGRRTLPNPMSLSQEWRIASEALEAIKQVFTEDAVLVMGNHEYRAIRALNSPLLPEYLKKILMGEDKWLQAIANYWCMVESENGELWRCTHPKNTSVIPVRVASRLAEKYHSNIIMSHNHLWGMTQTDSGNYLAIETGCIVDPSRLPYVVQRDNLRPKMQNGAVILRDGHAHLLHPKWSDWKALLRLR